MTNDKTEEEFEAKVRDRKGISAVWLVPVIALLFGLWLIISAVADRGVFVTVEFDNASGIVVGKTEVRYKGLTAGIVKNIEVSPNLNSVIATIEMVSSTQDMLTEQALFWYVTADVSFQGVTGLDTLLSGSYINFQPDFDQKGATQSHFIGLSEEPPLDKTTPGLHLTLETRSLGSIAKNSPVTFKQIKVGYVTAFKYDEDSELVKINVFIEPEYKHLVKENSRFWNASGLNISGSLTSGVKIKTESLASIIAGGIAFDNVSYEQEEAPAKNDKKYILYADYQTADMGHEITLLLNWDSGIDSSAKIMYHGFTLGGIDKFLRIDGESRTIIATAKVDPRVIPYLNDETQLYVVSPRVELGGSTSMSNIISGSYISIRASKSGNPQSTFNVLAEKPAYKYDEPGLHLVLQTDDVTSIKSGTTIFHKEQSVGSVQAIENSGPGKFLVHIHIKPEFQNYVSKDSRFWNSSGFRISGGLQSFEVQAESVQSILAGGIAFDTGISEAYESPENGNKFRLYRNIDVAQQRQQFKLFTAYVNGVSNKTKVIFRGETIGSVHQVTKDKNGAILTVGIFPEHNYILKEHSKFWLVKPELSLSGFTDIQALFGGPYISLIVGDGNPEDQFVLSTQSPAKHHSSSGLQLTLTTKENAVVIPGSAISYRGINVGQVDNVTLNKKHLNKDVNITIAEEYSSLISNFTRFYNVSGVTASGGIGNFSIKTESVDTILRGGISFYNSEQHTESVRANEGQIFTLFNHIDHAKSAGLAISIYFDDIDGVHDNLKIKYKSQDVGIVEHLIFDEDKEGVTVVAYLNDLGKRFAVTDTQFWLARSEFGLVGNKDISTLVTGGFIGILPSESEQVQSEFVANHIAPATEQLSYGLNIKLTANRLGSVRVGNPILYRQIQVGKVIGVDLAPLANKVNIFINIAPRYAPLITTQSKFWNTSGINIDAGMFSGVTIESESIETLVAGGIAFATPEIPENESLPADFVFALHDRLEENWLDWQPEINLNN
ncbi:MlaD family protein [Thalassotalea psychrophila]|uniref:MlaD family protein n=1 Tax=Thalassotalea psychrophila TaxID=3065647 RepID=A0ABY9TZB0_9GAMM|nr:MlaD family protein [Colwelliaceae bacterium SQ149]